jgi:hypothetical protein
MDRRPSMVAAAALAGERYFQMGAREQSAQEMQMLKIRRSLRVDWFLSGVLKDGVVKVCASSFSQPRSLASRLQGKRWEGVVGEAQRAATRMLREKCWLRLKCDDAESLVLYTTAGL